MTASDHVKITGPEDVLGFIPHSLGYWPAHSLVAMTLQGKRLGATLRVDLPDAGHPGGFACFARTVAGYLEADGDADGALLAFFTGTDATGTGDDVTGVDGSGWAGLLKELEHSLADSGMPVRDAWLIGAEYWRNAYCSDPSCCAPPGRPIAEITNSPLNAELVFRGSTVGPAPDAPAAPGSIPRDDPAVLESERGWAQLFDGHARDPVQFGQILQVWAGVLGSPSGPVLPVQLAGYLRAALCVPAWRDAVLVMAAAGAEAAARGAADFGIFDTAARTGALPPVPLPPLAGHPPLPPAAAGARPGSGPGAVVPGYGEVLLGLAPPVPDWPRMARLDRVLAELGGGGGEAGAAALTGRGWIEWCRGKGSFADALFRRADDVLPGYRLAGLLAELVRRGTLCGWAGRREAAWQRFESGAA